MTELNELNTIILKRDIMTNKGMTIKKDTEIYIIKSLVNPMTKLKEYIILIDNGTGIKELMPKDVITEGTLNIGIK